MMLCSDYNVIMLKTMLCFFYLQDLELDCFTGNGAKSLNLKRHLCMTLFHCDFDPPKSSFSTIKAMPKTKERMAAFEMY